MFGQAFGESMVGISVALDLLSKNPCMGGRCVNSYSLFSATAAASAAASSFAVTAPFATWAFFGKGIPVAYCDAGAALTEDYTSIAELPGKIFQQNPFYYSTTKQYNIALKPLFSAFHWKNLALTSLRSFLLFYLPLLEPRAIMDEDDDDLFPDSLEDQPPPDLVAPFKKSLKQIARDSTVVTTRRVLERLAVHYVSQRMACKLLKDAPKSALRKAGRGMPPLKYTCCVSRTTFRAHFVGILASWIVQVGIDIYRFFRRVFSSDKEIDEMKTVDQIQKLGGKIYLTTVRCGASLVFASIGAGIGAVIFKPSTGQWIGCAIGDLVGPVIVSYCFDKLLHIDL